MGVNAEYFSAVIHYLTAYNGEPPEPVTVKGMDAYEFHCPFCTGWVRNEKSRRNRTAKLINQSGDAWIFKCARGYSSECRGGFKSFYNFLLFLHPELHREYQISLGMTDARNHKEIRRFKRTHL